MSALVIDEWMIALVRCSLVSERISSNPASSSRSNHDRSPIDRGSEPMNRGRRADAAVEHDGGDAQVGAVDLPALRLVTPGVAVDRQEIQPLPVGVVVVLELG